MSEGEAIRRPELSTGRLAGPFVGWSILFWVVGVAAMLIARHAWRVEIGRWIGAPMYLGASFAAGRTFIQAHGAADAPIRRRMACVHAGVSTALTAAFVGLFMVWAFVSIGRPFGVPLLSAATLVLAIPLMFAAVFGLQFLGSSAVLWLAARLGVRRDFAPSFVR